MNAESPRKIPHREPPLTSGQKETVLAIRQLGGSLQLAAQAAFTTRRAIRRASIEDCEFGLKLVRAYTVNTARHLKNITDASNEPRYWRASAWVVERREPELYGQGLRNTETEFFEWIEEIARDIADCVSNPDERRRILDVVVDRVEDIFEEEIEPSQNASKPPADSICETIDAQNESRVAP